MINRVFINSLLNLLQLDVLLPIEPDDQIWLTSLKPPNDNSS